MSGAGRIYSNPVCVLLSLVCICNTRYCLIFHITMVCNNVIYGCVVICIVFKLTMLAQLQDSYLDVSLFLYTSAICFPRQSPGIQKVRFR